VTDLLGRTSTGKVTFVVGDGLAAPNSPTTDYNHAVGAHDTVKLSPVGGDCCTRGALVDVRVTNPKDTGSIVVYQNGTTRPDLATVQFHAGQAAENSAWVAVDFGDVDFYNTSGGTLDLNVTTFAIEDGTTYEAAPPEQTYHPVTPGQVLARTELAPQHKTVVTAAGVPADADDLVLDITESGSTATGTMITYGENIGTSSQVEVSSWSKGQQVTGLSMVPVNGGRVILVNDSKGNAYFTADVVGYTYFPYPPSAGETFDPATDGSVFLPATPDRLLKVTVAGKHWVKVAVAGKDGIPAASTGGAGTTAALVTLTAASTTANGSFTAYADGTSRPANVISLSYTSGQTAANTAIVQVGQDGEIDLYNGGSKPVLAVLDVDGSFYGY
jgi:hypothetical protein